MSTIDEQFVEYIVKSLVGNPEAVAIDRRVDDKGVLLELSVDAADLGRVIGKRGATAQSLRTLLRALGTKNEERYNLKIIDTADGEPLGNPTNPSTPGRQSHSDEAKQSNSTADDESKVSKEYQRSESPEPVEAEPEAEPEDEGHISDALSQTRKELAELDDLDV